MQSNRPSLKELSDRVDSDFSAEFLNGRPLVKQSFLYATSKAIVGVSHLLHGRLDWIARQIFPDTANLENLKRHARVWDIHQKPPSFASGRIIFKGKENALIPEDTELTRPDGLLFKTQEKGTIRDGIAQVYCICETSGSMGNTPSGSILTLVSPLPEIESKASIFEDSLTRGLTGGSDAESKESLLGRLLHKIRKPSLGGSKSDYEFWTRELPGISRVWVLPNAMGPGSVGVTFTTDNIEDPIPSPEKIAQVTANIEEKRPITARVYVYPLNAAPIDFEIKILPSDPNTKNKVKNALLKLFFHEAHPGGQILLSHIHRAILKAAEIEDYTIVEPKNDIQIGIGQLATLGRVQWVT